MKKIIFVRHAKSSWEHHVSDKDRPLKNRGKTDAKLIAKVFCDKQYAVDLVCSSPANRAYSTCQIFTEQLNTPIQDVKISDQLYDFEGERVINFIKNLDNAYHTVMLFGHNHAFTSIVNLYGDKSIHNVPTSGVVVINFDIDLWEFVKFGHTELVLFPRDYRP